VLHVGEELRCSASGNPTPQITFSPPAADATEGRRYGVAWRAMVVPAKWKGQRQTVNCTAVNELDGQQHTAVASATFDVTGQYATRSQASVPPPHPDLGGPDPTTSEVCWVQPISGPDQVLSR